jgi:hypothetical protein
MNHAKLLEHVYAHYGELLLAWEAKNDAAEDLGVIVFFPDGYATASEFEDVQYEYWTLKWVRRFLQTGGHATGGIDGLLRNLLYGEEFLIMIVESVDAKNQLAISVHKITKEGLN